MLERIDLTKTLNREEYKQQLVPNQVRLGQLGYQVYQQKRPVIIVYEGWDAGGKGTVISKLSQRLEPRGFSLYAIREPRTYELHLPWLRRFWVRLPNWGEMAIFDRSWYGRVLVERVVGLIDDRERRKAYNDIVSFERGLADDRYLIVKFFLHISKEQQEERVKELESDPATAWKSRVSSAGMRWLSSPRAYRSAACSIKAARLARCRVTQRLTTIARIAATKPPQRTRMPTAPSTPSRRSSDDAVLATPTISPRLKTGTATYISSR